MIYALVLSVELQQKSYYVLNKLKNAGMTINKYKCLLNCVTVAYLGYQISKDGISPEKI